MPEKQILTDSVCRFGVFEVDLATGELRKRGVRLKLQVQPFRILALLLERPGEVVSRETIRKTLWSEDTFVEFEQSISAAVGKLRAALGDSAEHPKFVETVARQGYRFIAPVSSTARPEAPAELKRTGRGIWMLAGALAAGLVLAIWILRTGREPVDVELRATPLTSYPGTESGPSFSPEGTRVAFSWDGPNQDNVDIYVKSIGPGDPIRSTSNPADDHDPAWSPDGNWIAFLRDVNGTERAILLLPALGGPERLIAHTRIVKDTIRPTNSPVLAWSADSKWLFTLDADGSSPENYAVFRVSVGSGGKEQVTFPADKGMSAGSLAVSPDGRTLAFTQQDRLAMFELFRVRLSQESLPVRAPEAILQGARVEGMAWTADSQEIVFSGEVKGVAGFWRLGMFGTRKLRRLTGAGQGSPRLKRMGRDRGVNLAISRERRRLVYNQRMFDSNLWRMGLSGPEKGKTVRFISSTRDEIQPDYSPDGQKIAFESDRTGWEEIWVCNADGGGATAITNFGTGWSGSPRWSPDGRTMVFDRLDGKNWAIYIVGSQGGQATRLTNAGDDTAPGWSQDGQWIYFDSNRTGRFQIWKMRAGGGSEKQITRDGGMFPLESLDGKDIYYSRSDGGSGVALWRMPAEGGEEVKVLDGLVSPRTFTVGKQGIYFLRGSGTSSPPFGNSTDVLPTLCLFDLSTRRLTTIGSVQRANLSGRITVSPDERWMLYGHDDGTGSDLMLVENFE